jgi:dipeptidyl aminopeptidase/acylaminoacyl peptidase
VSFDGSAMTSLSPEPGNHTIRPVPGAPFFIDTYSQIATPPITVLRDVDGKVVMELARGNDTPLRAIGWTPAEVFTVKARDGVTDLWGILHKPSTFDPTRHYPIVTYIYPGPQRGSVGDWVFKGPDWALGTLVETREDRMTATRNMGEEGMRRSLAELGFIVIQLDAMGSSPQRSKAFEDFFYGHVRDNGLPDHVAAIRQLAIRYPWIDTARVGIVGHSGGGYSAAAAMLHYPDFFKVGVSGSGNHDFRVYGWYWGEKYQGLYQKIGNSDNYEAEANYKYAANLKGKLLLMTGDMDCNNPPAETLRVVDALMKAGKDFDMLVVPDAGHQRSTYTIKRSWDYFVRNLLGAEPPADYRMLPP